MNSIMNYLLVISFASIATAIRVDWNTNPGPIVPPIPPSTVRPVFPYREPAAVWEDLRNDIPNPNPYVYVPPPPSRPKTQLNTNVNYNYGSLVPPQSIYQYYQQQQQHTNTYPVAGLAPQYLPNVGKQYVGIVPKINGYDSPSPYDAGYKYQGKYNAKTKKYKAYEKVKHLPQNYYPNVRDNDQNAQTLNSSNLSSSSSSPLPSTSLESPIAHEKFNNNESKQNLPHEHSNLNSNNSQQLSSTTTSTNSYTTSAEATHSIATSTATSAGPFSKTYSKHVYPKDTDHKNKTTKHEDKAKKS